MIYETLDRYEAAYLLSEGYELVDAKCKENNRLVTFCFKDNEDRCEAEIINYENDKKIQTFIQAFEQVNKIIRREQDKRSAAEQGGKYVHG